ncbi:hypothetical protein PMAC_003192 [Pneumocystis sp. 'macacae']|nr:hypothetical protein PMAC_003192 [Pneumocystis sp. 'macacae']
MSEGIICKSRCLRGICVDFDSIGGGKNGINGFFLYVKGEQEQGGERCAPGSEARVCTKVCSVQIKQGDQEVKSRGIRLRLVLRRKRIEFPCKPKARIGKQSWSGG